MARALILLCLLVAPLSAVAQDAADPATAPAAAYRVFEAIGYGFKLSLPSTGKLLTPASEGWSGGKSEACIWYADGAEPIKKIVGRSDSFGTQIQAEEFKTFCDALLEQWSADETKHRLLTKNKLISSGKTTWNVIEVEDSTGAEKVYYSVFLTYSQENIYTLSFYYDRMPSKEIQAFGQPILAGFGVTGN